MFKYFAFALGFMVGIATHAQEIIKCATDEYLAQAKQEQTALIKLEEQANNIALREDIQTLNKAGQIRYIPVVFHIIHKNGLENISQAQVMDQIRILNEDFRKKAGTNGGKSTYSVATDMEYEFRLAQYDPNGNKHDGINRIYNTMTDDANNNVKGLSYWDSKKYLNVWVVNTIKLEGIDEGIVLGFAQFPYQQNSMQYTDGVVIRSDQIGTVGIGQKSQAGRTLTHEVGHWMGLYHTFQGGCSSSGDGVSDTPPVASASSGCSKTRNSCHTDNPDVRDMVENYMDYSSGSCLELFTQGQKARVNTQMQQYRSTLYTNNILYAGIDANGNYKTPPAAQYTAPVAFDFESGNPFASESFVYNNFNNPAYGWKYTNTIGYESNSSLTLQNFDNPSPLLNGRDGFQLPEVDVSTFENPYLELYYAWAQKAYTNFDSLIITASADFGMTEWRIFAERGPNLATASILADSSFTPETQTEWRKASINIWKMYRKKNVRIRFEYYNRGGNNVYVDQISFSNGPTGLNDLVKKQINFSFYPNPFDKEASVTFELKEKQNVKITLTDLLGREIKIMENKNLSADKHEVKINRDNLKQGIYYLQFEAGEQRFSHKILIN